MYKLKSKILSTPIGNMLALADEFHLYLLEFPTKKSLARDLERFKFLGFSIEEGDTSPLLLIQSELKKYFERSLTKFNTPIKLLGTAFQQAAWLELCKIPYGETRSYKQQANAINKPTGFRAVASANGRNRLSIIVPCHRVIAADGGLGGYSGGLSIKTWLIEHESKKPRI